MTISLWFVGGIDSGRYADLSCRSMIERPDSQDVAIGFELFRWKE